MTSFPLFAGVPGLTDQIGDPSPATRTILLLFFDNFSGL